MKINHSFKGFKRYKDQVTFFSFNLSCQKEKIKLQVRKTNMEGRKGRKKKGRIY